MVKLADIKLLSDIGKTVAEIYSLHITSAAKTARIAELEKELATLRETKGSK